VGRVLHAPEGEPPTKRPVRASPKADVDQALGPERLKRTALDRRATERSVAPLGEAASETEQDLPVVALLGRSLVERRRVLRRVAHREYVERDVVVAALERTRGRKDQVGMTRRLVPVGIDAHQRFERAERSIEPCAVRRREHGISGDGEHAADPALRLDLLGERRDGKLAGELG
jgi:hypothetical protein